MNKANMANRFSNRQNQNKQQRQDMKQNANSQPLKKASIRATSVMNHSETTNPGSLVRINKYLAQCGVCSRREADRMIEEGRVVVNGNIAKAGLQVGIGDSIVVDGKKLQGALETVVLAFYKPVGVTCTEKDPHAQKVIADIIHYPIRVTYAGRLDKDSEGLLLLTNDGDLIDRMMRGINGHEKEYIVKVDKEVTESISKRLSEGIFLKELDICTRPCEVEILGKNTFRIILTQGLNRQIRRMCQACGLQVKSLKRVRVLNIPLGNLKPGEYREIIGEELKALYEACEKRA